MASLEIDVEAGENCPYPVLRVFSLLREPGPVSRVLGATPDGAEALLEVTGWADGGPCPAYAALVEDSGEGTVVLVYGGNQGIRLRRADLGEPWDLASPNQWGEPCLLLPPGTRVE